MEGSERFVAIDFEDCDILGKTNRVNCESQSGAIRHIDGRLLVGFNLFVRDPVCENHGAQCCWGGRANDSIPCSWDQATRPMIGLEFLGLTDSSHTHQ